MPYFSSCPAKPSMLFLYAVSGKKPGGFLLPVPTADAHMQKRSLAQKVFCCVYGTKQHARSHSWGPQLHTHREMQVFSEPKSRQELFASFPATLSHEGEPSTCLSLTRCLPSAVTGPGCRANQTFMRFSAPRSTGRCWQPRLRARCSLWGCTGQP